MLQQEFNAIELDNRNDGREIQAALGELTGATTVRFDHQKNESKEFVLYFLYIKFSQFKQVPRVFVNGNFIGGGTDVKKLNETGELKKLLE